MKDTVQPRAMRFFGMLLLALCLVSCSSNALSQYRYTQWTADTGLPQNSVRGLVQTPDGFLWIATLNGIAKFDGVHFRVFDKSNTPGITSNRFIGMVLGHGTDLWMLSEDGNVILRHGRTFQMIGGANAIRPRSAIGITGNNLGAVWVVSDGKVLRWSESQRRFERESFSTDGLRFVALAWTGTGFWAQHGDQIICFNRGHLLRFVMPPKIDLSAVVGVAVNANDEGWITTKDGRLGKLGDKAPVLLPKPDHFVLSGPFESDWKLEISPQRFERRLLLPVDGKLQSIWLQTLNKDNEGNIWVGSEGNGLFRIQKQSIVSLTTAEGLASNNTYPVLRSRTGDMWAGSWPDGLSQIRAGKVIHTWGRADGLPGLISSLAEDHDGVIWVGTHGGVRTIVDGRLTRPALPFADTGDAAQAILQSPDGTMLFGTPGGLNSVRGSTLQHLSSSEGLATNDVRTLLTDRNHDLWIGGYGGVTRIHNNQLTRWTEAEGLPSDNVRALFEDSDGEIWVGTYDGGIGWYRNGKWVTFNKNSGLFDNGAFQILEDGHKWFWISSNRGIYRVAREQLVAVAEGREQLVASIAYGRNDGMLSAECNGGLWPAGATDEQGRLWFPTQMGIAIVDPSKVRTVVDPPKVAVEAATVEHIGQPEGDRVVLKPGQTNLEISYTALSYTKPDQITFRYKMDDVDEDWQQVGLRRTAYYTHLPPGEHVFRVSARNSDGVRSQQDAILHVRVIPPFYRRWWFIACGIAVLILAVSAVWQLRVRQLKMAQARQQTFARELIASQEGERRRIAGELHDSLGQRLIIINNLALFLLRSKGKVRTEEEKRQTVEEISGEASAAIEETRAISYALRPFQLDRLGLTRAIQALCTTVMKASEIAVRTELADIDDAFSEELRINVYRIVQEALNNIVKHSSASTAKVKAFRTDESVTLTISDDGRGMPAKPGIPLSGKGGFGMTGMRERVTLLNGVFQVESSANAGTLLTIQLPTTKSAHL